MPAMPMHRPAQTRASGAEGPQSVLPARGAGRVVRGGAGEILGLAGLVGAGRSETLETIFGLRHATRRHGSSWTASRSTRAAPRDADPRRYRTGAGGPPRPGHSSRFFGAGKPAAGPSRRPCRRRPGLCRAQPRRVRQLLELLELPQRPAAGRQHAEFQRRHAAEGDPRRAGWCSIRALLLLDEPTRGVDIGTRSSIYALLRRIAAEGSPASSCRRISRK